MSTRRTVPHAEQIGELQPIILPPVPPSAELRALIAEHRLQRPDHLKCTHIDAPPSLRKIWSDWCKRLENLTFQLDQALHDERNRWYDADGNVVTPAPWPARPTQYVEEQRSKSEEMKAYRARKASGRAQEDGRPRSENPSPEALKKREIRAKKRALREAGMVA